MNALRLPRREGRARNQFGFRMLISSFKGRPPGYLGPANELRFPPHT